MLYEILAGFVAALGWPIGVLIYTISKEEFDIFKGKLGLFTRFYYIFAVIIGMLMVRYYSESAVIAGFLATMILGMFAVTKTQSERSSDGPIRTSSNWAKRIWKVAIIGFSIQLLAFLAAYFLS